MLSLVHFDGETFINLVCFLSRTTHIKLIQEKKMNTKKNNDEQINDINRNKLI